MSFTEIVTYIVIPAGVAIWGLVKWVIPRVLSAKLKGEEADRKHQQKIDELSHAYYHSEREVTNQAMASVVSIAQEEEKKANEFIRTTIFNSLDKIKTDTAHIPGLREEIRTLETLITGLITRQRMLSYLVTGGAEDEAAQDDYDIWKKIKLKNVQPSGAQNQTGGHDE